MEWRIEATYDLQHFFFCIFLSAAETRRNLAQVKHNNFTYTFMQIWFLTRH